MAKKSTPSEANQGKTKSAKSSAATSSPRTIRVTYDLFDLPTAQHKAGLAGLILQIRSMEKRRLPETIRPCILEVTATDATFEFTESSLDGIFNDLYDAEIVEVAVKSKWQGDAPKREEHVEETDDEGKVHKAKRFIYDVVQPSGHFLKQHLPDADGLWLKLWRNMLWDIPRGKPTTRIPFNARAAKRPCAEGAAAWKDLLACEKARAMNAFKTDEVSSALLLGAQAVNAEGVSFEGRVEQTLLLHFWPLTVLIYVPQRIDNDGEAEFVGYTLAIPEVSDLESFCNDYPRVLRDLDTEARGYRPAAAVIDLPDQSALEFLEHLARLSQRRAESSVLQYSVSSVEFLHLAKLGNNVKSMASGRVAPDPLLLEQYEATVQYGRSPYRNPLFRANLLRALLQRRPWYECFADELHQRPWPFFIRCDQTPNRIPWFSADAGSKFREDQQKYEGDCQMADLTPSGSPPSTPLELLVFRLIQTYVNRKTEEKCGLKWEDFKDRKVKDERTGKERIDVPQDYREAREKVASDAFLAMRSRREQDFVDLFTARICSVGQFLKDDDYQLVANALLHKPDDVKTLTLLALSANS